MRACLLQGQELKANSELVLSDEAFHHLVQVCRLREKDELLVLNGLGQTAKATVQTIHKRQMILRLLELTVVNPPPKRDALFVIPKKDALEAMLKMSVELGLRKVFLVRGAYSQERLPEEKRLSSLLQSAIEQSNNPWPPEIVLLKDWSEVNWNEYQHVLCFDPVGERADKLSFAKTDGILTLIGPEGGFSPEEQLMVKQLPNGKLIAWDTPILRAPTALSMAVGWVTARMA